MSSSLRACCNVAKADAPSLIFRGVPHESDGPRFIVLVCSTRLVQRGHSLVRIMYPPGEEGEVPLRGECSSLPHRDKIDTELVRWACAAE